MTLRVVTVGREPEAETALTVALTDRPDVEVFMRCVDRVELQAAVRGADLDAVVAVGCPSWLDAPTIREIVSLGVTFVGLVSAREEAETLVRCGGSLLPADASIDEVVRRCSIGLSDRVEDRGLGRSDEARLIAVWGPKGAPGRTSIAVEVACEMSRAHDDVLLLDADPYGGDIAQLLGIVEEIPTVAWVSRAAAKGELTESELLAVTRRVDGGPVVLAGLVDPRRWVDITEHGWREAVETCMRTFPLVVADVGFSLEAPPPMLPGGDPDRNMMTRSVVAASDRVVAVCSADPVGIKNFLWAFEQLVSLTDLDRICIVANKVEAGSEVEIDSLLRKHTGKRPVASVPYRPADFRRAVARGRAVAEIDPRSRVRSAIRTATGAVGGPLERTGFLTSLAGRA